MEGFAGRTSDVILSFSGGDRSTVCWLVELLRDHGLDVWLDAWGVMPGQSWQHRVEGAVVVAQAIAICVGASGAGPWREPGLSALLAQARRRNLPVVMLLLPGAQLSEPERPGEMMLCDCRAGFTVAEVARLVAGLQQLLPSVAAEPCAPSLAIPLMNRQHSPMRASL